jgi:hypothetical protein
MQSVLPPCRGFCWVLLMRLCTAALDGDSGLPFPLTQNAVNQLCSTATDQNRIRLQLRTQTSPAPSSWTLRHLLGLTCAGDLKPADSGSNERAVPIGVGQFGSHSRRFGRSDATLSDRLVKYMSSLAAARRLVTVRRTHSIQSPSPSRTAILPGLHRTGKDAAAPWLQQCKINTDLSGAVGDRIPSESQRLLPDL